MRHGATGFRGILVTLAVTGLVAAACGDDDDNASGDGPSVEAGDGDASSADGPADGDSAGDDGTVSTTPEGGVPAEVLEDLQAEVEAAQAIPDFDPQGPPFSVAELDGKRILSMPVTSQLEGCDRMSRQVVEIAESIGMEGTYFQNDGGTTAWIQGMELAINQGYDGVALVCGIDPDGLAPQMAAASDAGIEVVVLHLADVSVPANERISGQTNGEFARAMQMGVYQSLINSGGEPIDVLLITSSENPPSVIMGETVHAEFGRLCPACTIEEVNVPIPEWSTRLQGAVSSALVANPDLDAVFMVYDGMTPHVLPAIRAAGTDTLTYAFGADRTFVALMDDPANPMGSDMGPNFTWMAYSGADQLFRAMAGEPVIPADEAYAPYRMFVPGNAGEINDGNEGFGDEFIDGYRSLWLDAPDS